MEKKLRRAAQLRLETTKEIRQRSDSAIPSIFFFIINALGFGRLLIAFENLDVTLPAESFILSSEEDWLCIVKFDIPPHSIPSHSSLLRARTITFFIKRSMRLSVELS